MGAWEDGFAAGYREGISHTHTSVGAARRAAPKARSAPKRKGKPNPRLSRAMKKAYKKSHLKSGKFRKGWNQSKMLKYAHKIK